MWDVFTMRRWERLGRGRGRGAAGMVKCGRRPPSLRATISQTMSATTSRGTSWPMRFISASLTQPAMKMLLTFVAAVLAAGALGGCAKAAGDPSATGDSAACDNSGFLAAQHAHVNHAEVTFCGTVVRLRPAKHTRSGWHRYVYVDAGHHDVIEIDANLDEMGNFPVSDGEQAIVRGEYYYDSDGREGVHWTHRTDRGSHP